MTATEQNNETVTNSDENDAKYKPNSTLERAEKGHKNTMLTQRLGLETKNQRKTDTKSHRKVN